MRQNKSQARAFILGFSITYIAVNLLGFPYLMAPTIGLGWATTMMIINGLLLVSVIRKL